MLGRAPRAFREQLISGVDDAVGVVVLEHVVVDVDLVVCQRDHAAAGRHVADEAARGEVVGVVLARDVVLHHRALAVLAKIVEVVDQEAAGVAFGEVAVVLAAALVLDLEAERSEEHTSELQSLMRISYAVFCLKKKKQYTKR